MPVVDELLARPHPRLKHELFACLVEVTTPVCRTPDELSAALVGGRDLVLERAHRLGYGVLAAGMHPDEGESHRIASQPRYRKIAAELGEAAVRRQLVCGLHVHVGMPSWPACLAALRGVLDWLPVVLGLSANSPYDRGVETGFLSTRAGRIAELSESPAPPLMRTWRDWRRATAGKDYTRVWWDARPHPRLGTLEVRIADQQTSVRRSAALAALIQALAAAATAAPRLDRTAYEQARAGASRSRPSSAALDRLARHVEPAAHRFGSADRIGEVLAASPEAVAQLTVGRVSGTQAVVADLARRSEPE